MRAGRQRVHEQVEARVRARRQKQLGHHVGPDAEDVIGGELDVEQRGLLEEAAGVLTGMLSMDAETVAAAIPATCARMNSSVLVSGDLFRNAQ